MQGLLVEVLIFLSFTHIKLKTFEIINKGLVPGSASKEDKQLFFSTEDSSSISVCSPDQIL